MNNRKERKLLVETGRELLEQYAGQEALVKHFFQIRKTEDTGKR